LTGPQRLWFLHQILTQSFEDMQPGEARDAAMITAHGRMIGYLEALATEDAVVTHFESDLLGTLPETIARYVFATQVDMEDVTESCGLMLVAGPGATDLATAVGRGVLHPTSGLGIEAVYLWIDRSDIAEVAAALTERGAAGASDDELEAIRIARGVPRWGLDMNTKSFPQEVGIDATAVHFDKGCYLGQEAMAKIHFRGKVNRRLRRLVAEQPLRSGLPVELDGETVGTVTSAAGARGLALLRHTVQPGVAVTVGTARAEVTA